MKFILIWFDVYLFNRPKFERWWTTSQEHQRIFKYKR